MLWVVDYGAGNLYSLCNSLAALSIPHKVTADPSVLEGAERIILPGVGAFGDAMKKLTASGFVGAIQDAAGAGVPILGICLGMQLLFERSFEFGEHQGLALIPGEVRPIEAPGLRIPHMGWNSVEIKTPCPLTEGLEADTYFYFVHSFAAKTKPEYKVLVTHYGQEILALVQRGNVFGAQFHPEKSSAAGLELLRRFGAMEQTRC